MFFFRLSIHPAPAQPHPPPAWLILFRVRKLQVPVIRLVRAAPAPGGLYQRFAKGSRLQFGIPVIDALLREAAGRCQGTEGTSGFWL